MPILAIGPLRYALAGLDLPMQVAVRSRYARFLAPEGLGNTFRFDLSIAGDGAHQPGEMPVVTTVGPRRYTVDNGALQAEIDLDEGVGRATILPTVYIVDSLLRITTTLRALEYGALLLHASGVRLRDGRAWVCFGPSGVGKTTVARSVAPADVLCDEMILVDSEGVAHGTPFHGDLSLTAPAAAPIAALCRLVQAAATRLVPLSPAGAARALLGSVLFFSRDEELVERLTDLALRIGAERSYTLEFTRDIHVPTVVQDALRRNAAQAHA